VPLLLALAALGAAHHGGYRGWLDPTWGYRAVTVALDLVALLLAVIGGRVIPAFSANAVAGLVPRRWPAVEVLAVGLLLGIALLDASGLDIPEPARRGLFVLAALVHLLRLAGWQPWATRGNLLLLALPLAYLWLPAHLLLRALLDPGSGQMATLAVHALGIGAMAAMMLAMMTRSALGHTGRALVAGRAEIIAFAAVHVAAATRALGSLAWPQAHQAWLALSALAWVVAFAAFVWRYAPMVVRPRADDA
ncbi:MAG: NnrS family protein, partial [Pseudomonadales bacterium]